MERDTPALITCGSSFWTICKGFTVHEWSPAGRLLIIEARDNHVLNQEFDGVLSQERPVFSCIVQSSTTGRQMQHG